MTGRRALVLAGGGARGAYGAGVVRYLRGELARDLGAQPRLDLLSGTSIGAINACFLASTADAPATQGEALAEIWRSLRLEEVYQWGLLGPWAFARHLWRRFRDRKGPVRLSDLVLPEALVRVVERRIDWSRLHANVRAGHVTAVTVTATDLGSGRAVVFVESREPLPAFAPDAVTEVRARALGPEHALASGALPLLFRPVALEGSWYMDGSVRQNVPLLPVIRLGAERILVVALRDPPRPGATASLDPSEPPSSVAQLGRVLSALLVDRTEHDLARLRAMNELVAAGERAFGAGFAAPLAPMVELGLGYPLRHIEPLVVRPSRDLGDIARVHARRRLGAMRPGAMAARLLRRAADEAEATEEGAADVASYLLFDRDYADELLALGEADARAQRDALLAFFAEPADAGGRSA